MLDPDERLLITGVSPPIFGSQHCFRFRNQMQLNLDGLRLNTLYNLSLLECQKARNLRNYLERENGNVKEDGMEIDRHHTSKNGR